MESIVSITWRYSLLFAKRGFTTRGIFFFEILFLDIDMNDIPCRGIKKNRLRRRRAEPRQVHGLYGICMAGCGSYSPSEKCSVRKSNKFFTAGSRCNTGNGRGARVISSRILST